MIFACVVLQEFIQRRFNAIKGISIVLTGDRLFLPVRREQLVFPPLVFVVLRRGKSAEARGHGGLTPCRSPAHLPSMVWHRLRPMPSPLLRQSIATVC